MKTHAQVKLLLRNYDFLPPAERSDVDTHLAACPECASELAVRRLAEPSAETAPLPEPPGRATLAEPTPKPPVPLGPEPADDAASHDPFPWQRLLLPLGMVLLLIASIAFGLREPARGPRTPDPALAGTPRPGGTSQPGQTTIVFACDDVAAVYNDYAKFAGAFEKENPDVKVELKSYRDLLGDQSLSYVQTVQEIAASADAFCVWDVAPLVEAHLLYNLDTLVSADASFAPDDFYEAVLDTTRANGSLYAVPSRFQPALLRYDPRAFEQAGLPYPRPGWTWDDFLVAAVALTQRANGNTQRWGFSEDVPVLFNARFRAALGDPAFAAAASADHPLTSPAVVDLFRWYERFYVAARAAPLPRGIEDAGGGYSPVYVDPRSVSLGKMAMWTDLLYQSARRQGQPAPFPADGSGGGAPVYTGPAWAIAAETLHPQAAWRWVGYLSRNPPPDSQLRLPARRSLVEQSPFWKELSQDEAKVYRYILAHPATRDRVAFSDRVQSLYGVLARMVSSKMTLSELLTGGTAAVPTNIPAVILAAPPDQVDYYRAAAAAYMKASLNTNVQVIAGENLNDPARSENTALWSRMRQVAGRADALAGRDVAALARSGRAQGILLDLTSRTSDRPPGRGFYTNTLESLAWRGRVWAVPDRVSIYVVHYNQPMFDQLHVAPPQLGWTWEDFREIAQAVTMPGADKMKWRGFRDGLAGEPRLLLAATGPLVDYTVDPPRPLLDQRRVIDAVRWYAGLLRQGFVTTPELDGRVEEGAPATAAMWVGLADPGGMASLRRNGIGSVPFPANGQADATTPIEIQNAFAISAATTQPDAAWALITFLLDYREPKAAPLAGVSAQTNSALLGEPAGPPSLETFTYGLAHAMQAEPLRREEYIARSGLLAAVAELARGASDAAKIMEDAQTNAVATIGR